MDTNVTANRTSTSWSILMSLRYCLGFNIRTGIVFDYHSEEYKNWYQFLRGTRHRTTLASINARFGRIMKALLNLKSGCTTSLNIWVGHYHKIVKNPMPNSSRLAFLAVPLEEN